MENNNTNLNNQNGNNNSDSFYSYSYRNQENQDCNPNYFEKKEEEAYTAAHANEAGKTSDAKEAAPTYHEVQADGTYHGTSQPYFTGQAAGQGNGNDGLSRQGSSLTEGNAYGNSQGGASAYGSSQGEASAYGSQPEGTAYGSSQGETSAYGSQPEGAAYGSSQKEPSVYGKNQAEGRAYQGASQEGPAYGSSQNENARPGMEQFYHTSQWGPAESQEGKKASRRQRRQKAAKEKKPHGFGMSLAKCAAIAVVFGLVSSTVFYGTGLGFEYTTGKPGAGISSTANNNASGIADNSSGLSATSVSTATTISDVSDIVENAMPSIVSLTNMGQQEMGYDFFGRSYVQDTESAGSGIIIGQTEEEIYIATNNHVVANSTQLTVNFIDNQTVTAEIKGTDSSTDLAVVSVDINDIPSETMEKIKVATLGDSGKLKVGEGAVAIGNALGYGQSVTTGVISALEREVTVQDEQTGASITNDLIQTSAAINPGNSGGALLNMKGEVIGINSVKYSDTQVEGMGFSIPISAAEPIINSLITRELVDESKSAYLGVSGSDVTEEMSVGFGIPEGLYITLVQENSAAAQAGINKGDVMTGFDTRKVRSMKDLEEIIQYYEAGTEVEITLQSNVDGEWQERKVMAKLGKKNG